jgi:hypothetical protein
LGSKAANKASEASREAASKAKEAKAAVGRDHRRPVMKFCRANLD